MTAVEISSQTQEFLSRRLLGRLATVSLDLQPHVVPVWFLLEQGAIWISSYRSTRKIIDINSNPKCALVVDVENLSGGLSAVAVEGQAMIINSPTELVNSRILSIYTKYLGADGVLEKDPQSWLNSPENVLIKLTPTKIKAW